MFRIVCNTAFIRSTHPNYGLKRPKKNTKHKQALGPKSSPGVKGPNAHSAHGPTPRYGPSKASPVVEQTPFRLRAPRRGPSKRRQSPPRPRPPQPSPPRSLGAGENSASFKIPLGRLELRPNHLMGPAHLLLTTPRHGAGVRRRQPPRRTPDVTGVPSACSDHCAAIPGAVWISGTLCGHV